MFGDSFSKRKIVWSKRGDHIERREVDELQSAKNPQMNTTLEVEDKKQ